jgi:hypothetical protein
VKGIGSNINLDSTDSRWQKCEVPEFTHPAYKIRFRQTRDLSILVTVSGKVFVYIMGNSTTKSELVLTLGDEGVAFYEAIKKDCKVQLTANSETTMIIPNAVYDLLHDPNLIPKSVVEDFNKRGVPLSILCKIGYYLINDLLYIPAINCETGETYPFVCRAPGHNRHKKILKGSTGKGFIKFTPSMDNSSTALVCEGVMTGMALAHEFPNYTVISVGSHTNYRNVLCNETLGKFFPDIKNIIVVPDLDKNYHATNSVNNIDLEPSLYKLNVFALSKYTTLGDYGDLTGKNLSEARTALKETILLLEGRDDVVKHLYNRNVQSCDPKSMATALPVVTGLNGVVFREPVSFLNYMLKITKNLFFHSTLGVFLSKNDLVDVIKSPIPMLKYTQPIHDLMAGEKKNSTEYNMYKGILGTISNWNIEELVGYIPDHPLLRLDMYGFAFSNGFFKTDGSNHTFVETLDSRPRAMDILYPPIHLNYNPEFISEKSKEAVNFVLSTCMCGDSSVSIESLARMLRALTFGNDKHISDLSRKIYIMNGEGGTGKTSLVNWLRLIDPQIGYINPMPFTSSADRVSPFHTTTEDVVGSVHVLDDVVDRIKNVHYLKERSSGGKVRVENKGEAGRAETICASFLIITNRDNIDYRNDSGMQRRVRPVHLKGKLNVNISVDTLGVLSANIPAVFWWITNNINTTISDDEFFRSIETEIPPRLRMFADMVFKPEVPENPLFPNGKTVRYQRFLISDEQVAETQERTVMFGTTSRSKIKPVCNIFNTYSSMVERYKINDLPKNTDGFIKTLQECLSYRELQMEYLGVGLNDSLYSYSDLFTTVGKNRTQYVKLGVKIEPEIPPIINDEPIIHDEIPPIIHDEIPPIIHDEILPIINDEIPDYKSIINHLRLKLHHEICYPLVDIASDKLAYQEFVNWLYSNYFDEERDSLILKVKRYRDIFESVENGVLSNPNVHDVILDEYFYLKLIRNPNIKELRYNIEKANDTLKEHYVGGKNLHKLGDKMVVDSLLPLIQYLTPSNLRESYFNFFTHINNVENVPDGYKVVGIRVVNMRSGNEKDWVERNYNLDDINDVVFTDDVWQFETVVPVDDNQDVCEKTTIFKGRVNEPAVGINTKSGVCDVTEWERLGDPNFPYTELNQPYERRDYKRLTPVYEATPESTRINNKGWVIGDRVPFSEIYNAQNGKIFTDQIRGVVPYIDDLLVEFNQNISPLGNPNSALGRMCMSKEETNHVCSWVALYDELAVRRLLDLTSELRKARREFEKNPAHPNLVDFVYPHAVMVDYLFQDLNDEQQQEKLMNAIEIFNKAQLMLSRLEKNPEYVKKNSEFVWEHLYYITPAEKRLMVYKQAKKIEETSNVRSNHLIP